MQIYSIFNKSEWYLKALINKIISKSIIIYCERMFKNNKEWNYKFLWLAIVVLHIRFLNKANLNKNLNVKV